MSENQEEGTEGLPDNSFYAPWRNRLPNGLPCWRSHPGFVLPAVSVVPGEDGGVYLVLMAGESRLTRHIQDSELLPFFNEWRNDPEQTLLVWFDRMPPVAAAKPQHRPSGATTPPYLDPAGVSNVSTLDVEDLF
jgi:hypothetical protein